jgi:prepilin signal peptidase PulO-like enzyme (type II secretory pathway)
MRFLVFTVFCILISLTGIRTLWIPDALLIMLLVCLAYFDRGQGKEMLTDKLCAGALSFGLFAGIYYFCGGIGFGDVKYAAVNGCALGTGKTAIAFFCAALACCAVYLAGRHIFHWSKKKKLPFAPFLSFGALAAMAFPAAGL